MNALPAIALLALSTALGVYLGLLYLRRVRRPVLIGLHLLSGAGALEVTLLLLRGTPDGAPALTAALGPATAALLALAMLSGFACPLISQRSYRAANVMLIAHLALGAAGFLALLLWAWSI